MKNKLNPIPAKYRPVYQKVIIEGKDFMQAARELKITLDTVRVHTAKVMVIIANLNREG